MLVHDRLFLVLDLKYLPLLWEDLSDSEVFMDSANLFKSLKDVNSR